MLYNEGMALPEPTISPPVLPVEKTDAHYQAHRKQLIHVLQMAYSGEKSAALAYQGHAASRISPEEKAMILQIEREEWEHRERVRDMLTEIQGEPSPVREVMQVLIGRCIRLVCPWCGWFLPMLGAWLLEEANIKEYARAADHARAMGLPAMASELMGMSEVEKQHADYFHGRVDHFLGRKP